MKLIYNVKDFESNYIMVQKWHPFEQDLCIHFYFMFHLMVCLDVSWRVYNNSMCVQWIDSSEQMRWHDGSSYTHSGFCLSELTNNNDIANCRVCFLLWALPLHRLQVFPQVGLLPSAISMPSRFKKGVFCLCKTLGFFRDEWNWMKHWNILKCLGKSWKIRTQSGHRVTAYRFVKFCDTIFGAGMSIDVDQYRNDLRQGLVVNNPCILMIFDHQKSSKYNGCSKFDVFWGVPVFRKTSMGSTWDWAMRMLGCWLFGGYHNSWS